MTGTSSVSLVASGNIFVGSDQIVTGAWTSVNGNGNWLPATATVPAGFLQTTQGTDPGLINRSAGDVHLAANSSCIGLAPAASTFRDGNGATGDGVPTTEYVAPLGLSARRVDSQRDSGAYEAAPVGGGTGTGGGSGGSSLTASSAAAASTGSGGHHTCGSGGLGGLITAGLTLMCLRRRRV